jgi:DNA (cytosine-5)-methyltransferase 1
LSVEIVKLFTAIDLFCGAGGLTVGLKNAGFEVLAGVEINQAAIESYRLNHPKHKLYQKDIRQMSPLKMLAALGLRRGELDLLAGCPPCQGFSTHRTRNKTTSIDDARNDLVFEFVRFVREMLPKTIMMENVPGLAKDRRMNLVVQELVELGYMFDDESVVIRDAADYGVPQRRRRMIMLASRFGKLEAPQKVRKRRTVRDAIFNMADVGLGSDVLHDTAVVRNSKVCKIISLIPKDGGSRLEIPEEYWLPCHKKNPGSYRDVYGRMAWDDVSPTITGGCHQPSKGRFIHPEKDRGITLREAALLQTFPKSYKFSFAKGREGVALQIGNALPPLFIQKQAQVLIKHLQNIS